MQQDDWNTIPWTKFRIGNIKDARFNRLHTILPSMNAHGALALEDATKAQPQTQKKRALPAFPHPALPECSRLQAASSSVVSVAYR
jgi:hypothetical protein